MSTIKADNIATLAGVSTSMANAVNGSAKAWVNFNGTGTVAIRGSYNVSSITDNGTGEYTVNFTNAMTDANYVAHITHNEELNYAQAVTSFVRNASSFRFSTFEWQNARIDPTEVFTTIFR